MQGLDVRLDSGDTDRSTSEAHSLAVGRLRRQPEGRPHCLFPGVESTIAAILLKVGLGALGEKDTPSSIERGAGGLEAHGCAVGTVTWLPG